MDIFSHKTKFFKRKNIKLFILYCHSLVKNYVNRIRPVVKML